MLGTKDGKSYQKDIKSPESDVLVGKKIGDKLKGDFLGFPGYEFELRGGSDKSGFPMRLDVKGTQRRRIFTTRGLGTKHVREGTRVRKTVAGNTLSESIVQVNLKVIKEGASPLGGASAEGSEDSKAEE